MNPHSDGKGGKGQADGLRTWEKPATADPVVGKTSLAPWKSFGLAVQPGGYALLAEETLDEEHGLDRKWPGPQRARQGKLTLVGDLLGIHPTGLRVINRE